MTEVPLKPSAPPPEPEARQPAAAVPTEPAETPQQIAPSETVRPWREELSERVENFRRRRAQILQGADADANLDFDFESAGWGESELGAKVIEFPQGEANLDVTLESSPGPEVDVPVLDSLPLERAEAPAALAGEFPVQPPPPAERPVEIVLESPLPPVESPAPEDVPMVYRVASLGRRFLAGLADALLLALAGGLFAFIFWRAGGHFSPHPLNYAVLAFIVTFFILAYFGAFTSLASATPGLLWVGLEVRNLEGNSPTIKESCWRAIGYLVSMAALMLGFVWALVDGEGLTWHDRMSGTFVSSFEARGFDSEM